MVGDGLRDWVIQRISALVLGSYFVFILFYLFMHPAMSYQSWQTLFSHTWMRVFSLMTLLSLLLHAWIGVWTIFTDYIKPQCVRLTLQVIIILSLVYFFFWGIEILWGL